MKDRALVPGRADEETMTRLMNDHAAALLEQLDKSNKEN